MQTYYSDKTVALWDPGEQRGIRRWIIKGKRNFDDYIDSWFHKRELMAKLTKLYTLNTCNLLYVTQTWEMCIYILYIWRTDFCIGYMEKYINTHTQTYIYINEKKDHSGSSLEQVGKTQKSLQRHNLGEEQSVQEKMKAQVRMERSRLESYSERQTQPKD